MSAFFPGVTAQQLASVPLFQDLGDEAVEAIRSRALFVGVHPGYRVIKAGEAAHDLYVVQSGEFDVVKDGSTVATLGVGDVFGEMAMLADRHRNADVVATKVSSLVTMTANDFHELARQFPDLEHRLRDLAEQRLGG